VLAPLLVAFGVRPSAALLLVPAGVLALALLGTAFGVVVGPFGVLYDDVAHALPLIAGFWFFLTPVVYPSGGARILQFNPVTPLLDATRAWLTSGRASGGAFFVVTLAAAVVLAIAWLVQRVARPHVVARLG
jgi:lipopolysaccharide transport system permease protein